MGKRKPISDLVAQAKDAADDFMYAIEQDETFSYRNSVYAARVLRAKLKNLLGGVPDRVARWEVMQHKPVTRS